MVFHHTTVIITRGGVKVFQDYKNRHDSGLSKRRKKGGVSALVVGCEFFRYSFHFILRQISLLIEFLKLV